MSELSKASMAARDAILKSNVPPKDIAKTIGKPYSTLMRELNPIDTKAKLSVDTFIDIMKCTGDLTPLEVMAEELGCKVVPTR